MNRLAYLFTLTLSVLFFSHNGLAQSSCPYPTEMWEDLAKNGDGFFEDIYAYSFKEKYEVQGNDCSAWQECLRECRKAVDAVGVSPIICDFHIYYSPNRGGFSQKIRWSSGQILKTMKACGEKNIEAGETFTHMAAVGDKRGTKEEYDKQCAETTKLKPTCPIGSEFVEGSQERICSKFILNSEWVYKDVHECEPSEYPETPMSF